jgi:hypothetical protein
MTGSACKIINFHCSLSQPVVPTMRKHAPKFIAAHLQDVSDTCIKQITFFYLITNLPLLHGKSWRSQNSNFTWPFVYLCRDLHHSVQHAQGIQQNWNCYFIASLLRNSMHKCVHIKKLLHNSTYHKIKIANGHSYINLKQFLKKCINVFLGNSAHCLLGCEITSPTVQWL